MELIHLKILGHPILEQQNQVLELPVRKALALLCYLALEPIPHTREYLATLLWPNAQHEQGRTALRQTLQRIRQTLQGSENILKTDRDTVNLRPGSYTLDYHTLIQTASAKQHSLAALQSVANLYRGPLMQGFILLDAPEFEEWLDLCRHEALQHMDRLLEHLAQRYAQDGQRASAIQAAKQRLALDNLNEAAYHQLIQLYSGAGKRTEVLETYRSYQRVLSDELGLAPNPEITVLVEQLRGKPTHSAPTVSILPLKAAAQGTYTTQLVGRTREWTQLEAAYAKGLFIYIVGQPGIGKTRLMQEFAASKGGVWGQFSARPSDLGVPFASYARSIRNSLKHFSTVRLEPWVQAELSRIIPEISNSKAPNTLLPPEAKLRLFHAIAEFHIAIAPHMTGMLLDDIQFYDQASTEAALYHVSTWQQFGGANANTQHFMASFRTGEMPPGVEEGIRQQAAAGLAALIELDPLSEASLQEMLAPLMETPNPTLVGKIHRFTEGNPMFALETLNNLGQHSGALDKLPLAPSVQKVISARLEQLSKPARNLARLAAIAGSEFSLELAQKVFVGVELLEALEELETRQFFSGLGFAHDLLYETTLQSVPLNTRTLLHSSILRALKDQPPHPVVMLRHALGAQNLQAVLKYRKAATSEAQELQTQEEIAGWIEKAAAFLRERGMPELPTR